MTEIEEPDWIAQARMLINNGADVTEVAKHFGRGSDIVRYALDINGAKSKQKARVRASRAREQASRVGVRPRAPGRRPQADVNEDRVTARAYADPKPAPLLTLPRISLTDIDEPMTIRFAPKTRREPKGVERWRTIHHAMIRSGKLPEPSVIDDFHH